MRATSRLRAALRSATDDRFALALRLTLLGLLLRPVGDATLRPFLLALPGVGLLFPAALRRPALWWTLTGLTGLRVGLDWPLADNHAYLLCYWCLAVALALSAADPRRSLADSARWLIGLVFALATLWKVALSPDYLNGTFFRVTLATDPRFADLARLLGGLSADALAEMRSALLQHADAGLLAHPVPALPTRLALLADALTGWTVAIEAAVALAFLWPLAQRPARARDACLLIFCATTYAVATVDGFAWLLIAMGVAQTAPDRDGTRALYLLTFAAILFYREVPWLSLLAEHLAPI